MPIQISEYKRQQRQEHSVRAHEGFKQFMDQQYAWMVALAVKLDADVGVTDTDYAAQLATYFVE